MKCSKETRRSSRRRMRIPQKTTRNYTEKKKISGTIMKISKRNKEDFSKKNESSSENKEKLHGEEYDVQDNNVDNQKKQEGLLKEG